MKRPAEKILMVLLVVCAAFVLVSLVAGCVIVRSGLPGGQHAESTNPACLIGCTANASTAASAPASGAQQ